jgi:hypothetical protein
MLLAVVVKQSIYFLLFPLISVVSLMRNIMMMMRFFVKCHLINLRGNNNFIFALIRLKELLKQKEINNKLIYPILVKIFHLILNPLLQLLLQMSACKQCLFDTLPCLLLIARIFKFSCRRKLGAF